MAEYLAVGILLDYLGEAKIWFPYPSTWSGKKAFVQTQELSEVAAVAVDVKYGKISIYSSVLSGRPNKKEFVLADPMSKKFFQESLTETIKAWRNLISTQ